MKWKGFFKKLDRLEVYLLAAENPVGKRQLRPIFRRKRNKEVLTREQVVAIKRGRRVLRREMKEQGLKRRIDFEVTAQNLGLFFDRGRIWGPFFLWLIRDNTAAKLLATTAVLTTTVTVTQPVIQYVTQYVTQFVLQPVTQPVVQEKEVNRFTIDLHDGLYQSGFSLSETKDFKEPQSYLTCKPVEGIPCVSIRDIPKDVDTRAEGVHHDENNLFFAYTFYCRYESTDQQPTDYEWAVNITMEETPGSDVEEGGTDAMISDAVWVMIFEDGEMTFHAKQTEFGDPQILPGPEITEYGYQGMPMGDHAKDPEAQYELIAEGTYYDFYRVVPKPFLEDGVVARGSQKNVQPNDIHKYTVVIWLEGDDPDCTNEMLGAKIGMNFQINMLGDEVHGDIVEEV